MTKTTPNDIKKLGTILSVWAHPDDETFTAAGIMATAVKNGQNVICVTATKGEAGVQDPSRWPADTLGEVRTAELMDALSVLGVDNHHWLGYKDGQCKKIPTKEAVNKIIDLINKYQPDTILTFAKDGLTGHDDHCTVSKWVKLAVERLDKKPRVYHAVHTKEHFEKYLKKMDHKLNIYFNIEQPKTRPAGKCDILLKLNKELVDIKHEALRRMPSQTEKMLKSFDRPFIEEAIAEEAFLLAL